MSFPLEALAQSDRQLGLLVALVIGFGFGFVLERAGFGRAPKLVAQFYGDDMTVFKVMFTGIVTAMLGLVILDNVGVVELRAIAESAASPTYLWPMVIGGFLLGVGFIVSGYCPGTSVVAAASGKLDALMTIAGVVVGGIVYAELQPLLGGFHTAGDLGHVYLYDLLGMPPAALAALVTLMAVGCFLGAEWLERRLRRGGAEAAELPRRPRTLAWAGLGSSAAIGLATLLFPVGGEAKRPSLSQLDALTLAQRLLDAPWTLRVLDLRPLAECAQSRIPTSECVPESELPKLTLAEQPSHRTLVLVHSVDLREPPEAAAAYHGELVALTGGFGAWRRELLEPPSVTDVQGAVTPKQREALRLRAGLRAALTGVAQPPPPPAPTLQNAPVKRKAGGGGGCGG